MEADGKNILGRYVQQGDRLTAIVNGSANFHPTDEQIRESMKGPQDGWLTHMTLLPRLRIENQLEIELVVHRGDAACKVNYDAEGRAYFCVDQDGNSLELVDIVSIHQ